MQKEPDFELTRLKNEKKTPRNIISKSDES